VCDLLRWTSRPTARIIKSGFLSEWPEEQSTAATFSSLIDTLVQECRQKAKSMTTGAKLPASYIKIINSLRKLKPETGEGLGDMLHRGAAKMMQTTEPKKHKLGLSPEQKKKVLKTDSNTSSKRLEMETLSLTAASSGSDRDVIFAMYGLGNKKTCKPEPESVMISDSDGKDSVDPSSQADTEPYADEAPEKRKKEEEEEEEQEENELEEPQEVTPVVPAAVVVDWATMQAKQISSKGIQLAELEPDPESGYCVAQFGDTAYKTEVSVSLWEAHQWQQKHPEKKRKTKKTKKEKAKAVKKKPAASSKGKGQATKKKPAASSKGKGQAVEEKPAASSNEDSQETPEEEEESDESEPAEGTQELQKEEKQREPEKTTEGLAHRVSVTTATAPPRSYITACKCDAPEEPAAKLHKRSLVAEYKLHKDGPHYKKKAEKAKEFIQVHKLSFEKARNIKVLFPQV
jgi:hypothetical protein